MNLTPEEIEDLYGMTAKEYTMLNPSPSSDNNGGTTDYYNIDPSWKTAQDIIESREMNFAQGNIFKAAFAFNVGRHKASTYERELNKIAWFVSRELERIKNKKETK